MLDTGAGDDVTTILGTGAGSTVHVHGQSGDDSVTLGDGQDGVQDINGSVLVDNSGGRTSLAVDDSGDANPQTIDVNTTSSTGSVGGLMPQAGSQVGFVPSDLSGLQVTGGSGGNHFVIDGTAPSIPNVFTLGSGADRIDLEATTAGSTTIINPGNGTCAGQPRLGGAGGGCRGQRRHPCRERTRLGPDGPRRRLQRPRQPECDTGGDGSGDGVLSGLRRRRSSIPWIRARASP